MKDTKNIHQGHRQRLKDKVRKFGLSALNDHEKLELLLTYSIPYKDTNELAHYLLNNYGSFKRVLNAPKEDLLTHKGVGEETALFLTTFKEFVEFYNQDKSESMSFNTISNCVEYFRNNISITRVESSYLIFIDNKNKFLKKVDFGEGETYSTKINRDELAQAIAITKAKRVILFHTHPNGSVNPSQEDVFATASIDTICRLLGVELVDHIIINADNYYSFRQNGLLNNIATDNRLRLNQMFSDLK